MTTKLHQATHAILALNAQGYCVSETAARAYARAVIGSIRQPSDKMIAAAIEEYERRPSRICVSKLWGVMVDEILGEQT